MRKECCLCEEEICEGCQTCRTCEGTGTVPAFPLQWSPAVGAFGDTAEFSEVECPDCVGEGIQKNL